MPIYMDRHDVSADVTAEKVALLHQEDLKIQHEFDCTGLTYWFDGKRKTAFCLINAPNIDAIRRMHDKAHGEIPHSIIEVDDAIVESFLGRIEDPRKSQNTELNIINDPAFRTIMVIRIKRWSLKEPAIRKFEAEIGGYRESILKTLQEFEGSMVKQKSDRFLASFDSVTNAISCAVEMQQLAMQRTGGAELNIGLSAGVPVTDNDAGLFADTIRVAERLCDVVVGQIVVSSEVRDLYESENLNVSMDSRLMIALNVADERFINMLMDYTERVWFNTDVNADTVSKSLGYSKSQLYRKMVSLTGLSPNNFIMTYRLNKALDRLEKAEKNIGQIALETGFNSPEYFSKCFHKRFGVLPSAYGNRHR